MLPMQLITACDGLLALNDIAFELCREFVRPHGDRLFVQVSRYEEYLQEIAKPPEFQPRAALRLILPFLKAHGLTEAQLRDFCGQNLKLLTGAPEAYKFLHRFGFPSFAFVTGYRQLAEALGQRLGFKAEQIVATDLDLDRFALPPAEAEELGHLEAEIIAAPAIELPVGAGSLADLPGPSQQAVAALDRIFGQRLPGMAIGALCREVEPLAGAAKAQALSDSLAQTGLKLTDVIYLGSDASDVQAFAAVRAGGGLAVSYNGNREAVAAAEVVVVSDCAWPIGMLAAIFRLWGKEGILEVAAPETRAKSRALVLPEEMIEPIAVGLQGHLFNIYLGQNPNLEQVIQESEAMRARLRGEAIASIEQ